MLTCTNSVVGMFKCDSFATNFEPLVEQSIHSQGYGVVLNLSLEVMSEMLSMSFVRKLKVPDCLVTMIIQIN